MSVSELIDDGKRHFQFDYMKVVVLAAWCI
jgi:hypothetical protein